MDFNHYFTNDEVEKYLKEWAEAYPDLMQLSELGKSVEGRPLWLATITNQKSGPDADKAAVWIDANIHALEFAGTTTSLKIIYTLLTEYGKDQGITRLLDSCAYYIAPRVNPDGVVPIMAEHPHYLRSGVRPYPWMEKDEGLHAYDDVNKDGMITQMRIKDPNGDWKVSSLDPRLMERRGPDEYGGEYYRLFPEGFLEGYDGYDIKMARSYQGLDYNRNFPVGWRPESDQPGAGPYPGSEPETKAMIEFISNHRNINTAITLHTYSGVLLRSPSTYPEDEMDAADLWIFKAIGKRGEELTGYPCKSVFHDFKYHPKEIITGGFDDWMYDHLGVYSFTIEQWDIVGEAGIKDRKFVEWLRDHPHEEDLKILQWADENAGENAYIDWFEYEHPQLGKVELGGWNRLYSWRNPPKHLMSAEADRHVPFAITMGNLLPRLEVLELKAEQAADDTYKLTLVVENGGFLPSFTSNQGKKRKVSREVRVELELPEGAELITGKKKTKLGHLEGRSNKIGQTFGFASPTDNRARAEWSIKAKAGQKLSLSILSDRAGNIHKEVIL